VTTPLWAVALDAKLYVFTANSTGKAKRVRATGRVRFAPEQHERPTHPWRVARGYGASRPGRGTPGQGPGGLAAEVRLAAVRGDAVYRLRGLYRDRVVLELIRAPGT
jgi:hypothetical protein